MRIRYFAWIKDITNKDDDIIDINHPKTIQELKKYLENLIFDLILKKTKIKLMIIT